MSAHVPGMQARDAGSEPGTVAPWTTCALSMPELSPKKQGTSQGPSNPTREAKRGGPPWFPCLLGPHKGTLPPNEIITLSAKCLQPHPRLLFARAVGTAGRGAFFLLHKKIPEHHSKAAGLL